MKIPPEVIYTVNPGSSDSELKAISEEHGIPFDDLWTLRKNKSRIFRDGVAGYMRYQRQKDRN